MCVYIYECEFVPVCLQHLCTCVPPVCACVCAELSGDLRIRLYTVRVVCTLLYGCESWHLNSAPVKNLRGFHSRCLARIYKCEPAEVLQKPLGPDIRILVQRRWRWLGHILRMDRWQIVRRMFDASSTKLQPPYPLSSLMELCP